MIPIQKTSTEITQSSEPSTYYFGPFCLDVGKRKLFRDSQVVELTAKCFEVLLALVARTGQVVSKYDLMTAAWGLPDVSDATLTQHIFMLRKVLGDMGQHHEYVATAPKIGYSFVCAVRHEGALSIKRAMALQYCVNAKEFWERRNEAAVGSAIALYREALKQDPENSLAYGGLAECFYIQADYMFVHPKERLEQAEVAAKLALFIDPSCAEAHIAMAKTAVDLRWDWDSAERSLRIARQHAPDNNNALFLSAWYLILQKRFGEAQAFLDAELPARAGNRLLELCPAMLELYVGRIADARRSLSALVGKYPDLWIARWAFAQALFLSGEPAEACGELDRVRHAEFDPFTRRQVDIRFLATGYLIFCLFRSGNSAQAERVWDELRSASAQRYTPALAHAMAYIATRRYKEALNYIAQGREDRCCWYTQLLVEPFVDELRAMPEFQALLPRRTELSQG